MDESPVDDIALACLGYTGDTAKLPCLTHAKAMHGAQEWFAAAGVEMRCHRGMSSAADCGLVSPAANLPLGHFLSLGIENEGFDGRDED